MTIVSKNKERCREEIRAVEPAAEDVIRPIYVEFLGLKSKR